MQHGEEMRHAASAMRGGLKSIACIQMVPTKNRVMLTPAQRDVIYAIYDPNGPQSCPSLVRWRHTWHWCMSVAPKESNETSNRMRAPTFSRAGVGRSELRRVLELDGGTVVCPALSARRSSRRGPNSVAGSMTMTSPMSPSWR